MSERTMYGLTIACERCGHVLLATRVRASRMLPPLDIVPARHAKALRTAQDRHEEITGHTCRLRFVWGAKAKQQQPLEGGVRR